jgi:hypothetical protein
MSIEAMITGKLVKPAEAKVSGSGKPYALLLVAVGEDQLCRAMLFGDDCERFARLQRGDAVALVGSLQVGIWNEKPSLTMLAHRAVSPSERKPSRPKQRPDTPSQSAYRAAAHAQRQGELPDDIPWPE